MNNLNQNKTDNFFRQALSTAPNLSPSEDDWKKMERLLKTRKKRKAAIVWFYLPAGIAAGLLVFFSLWFSKDPEKPLAQIQKKNNTTTGKIEIENKNETIDSGAESVILDKSTQTKSSDASQGLSESGSLIVQTENEAVENSETALPEKRGQFPSIDYTVNHDFRKIHELNPGSIPLISSEILIHEKEIDPVNETQDQSTPPLKKDGKLVLSLALTGDMNSVNGLGNSKTGLSYGLGVSYKILKTLSLGTGVYYSEKKYTSDKYSYYTTEKPFATWASYSRQIDADCKVIDIPLNLNFQLLKTEKTGIIASAGLSSYLMLSEKYNFIYNYNPNSQYSGRQYTIKNENKHILSVVNLSIGIEKPLGKQNSIVILPYAKLPLEGIGQGQTELKSFGLGFQLNYSMKKKDKFFNRKSE